MLAADIDIADLPGTPSAKDADVTVEVASQIDDVNGDGKFTSLDALAVLNSINDSVAFPATPSMDLSQNGSAEWGDYKLVMTAIQSQNLAARGDPVTLEYRSTDQKTIRVERPMPAAGRSLYPITITLHASR